MTSVEARRPPPPGSFALTLDAALDRRKSERRSAPRGRGWLGWWLRWYGASLLLLAQALAGGLVLLLIPIQLGVDGENAGLYVFLSLYLPFSGTAYLALLAVFARGLPGGRVWAFVLVPLFWGFVPIFAIGVLAPGISAIWVALLTFAFLVEVPARRGALGPIDADGGERPEDPR